MKNCILVTGGGTAGHIMPIIAMLPYLRENFREIVYVGSKNGMEKEMLRAFPFVRFCGITTVKFDRANIWKNFKIPYLLYKGMRECKKIIKAYGPNCIFSKGGYVSLPAVLACGKVPVIAHESDTTLGLANKIIYSKCKVMCTNFSQTANKLKKGVYAGLPIRNFASREAKNKYVLFEDLPTILIIGGSLGSKSINETVYVAANKICEKANVIHIVGKGNFKKGEYPRNYNQFEYVEDMGYVFSVSTIAVSRAGANTIAELLSEKIPMLLIPLSKKASRGDQIDNAKFYAEKGYANVLLSENLTPQNLINEINFLLENRGKIAKAQEIKQINSKDIIMNEIIKHSI